MRCESRRKTLGPLLLLVVVLLVVIPVLPMLGGALPVDPLVDPLVSRLERRARVELPPDGCASFIGVFVQIGRSDRPSFLPWRI